MQAPSSAAGPAVGGRHAILAALVASATTNFLFRADRDLPWAGACAQPHPNLSTAVGSWSC